ncbi:Aldo/keto reductase [Aureobasidium pullulans]|uniref:Aldo/keto reductase n=1 Tax=Aureobasidium pullulans TaxID=5580 RepID=A0A4V4LG76_AURPU|nr:Aldo/keto reductase [Aureobasidium pullulans]
MSKPANTTLRMLYGTAWKKERTTALVTQALQTGFLAVDTAAQPKHYQEHLVGKGVRTFLSGSNLTRGELYLQTKYTSTNGQDPNNLPYDPSTSITEQVKASVASSLHNLRHTEDVEDSYIDCLVLHSPLPNIQQTMEAWDAMASFVPAKVHSLGISNTSLPILEYIWDNSNVKPKVVQNRFYAATGWDIGLREFCKENSIEYQSFWTLTGNPKFLGIPLVTRAAEEIGVSVEVAIYALVQGLGITPINGTTSHIETDIAELLKLEEWKAKGHNSETWGKTVRAFELLLQKWSLASY